MNIKNTILNRISLILYRLYLSLIGHFRSSKILHQYFFGYRPCYNSEIHGDYWDWTTLILKKALQRHLKPDNSFLDMGTGSVGVLAIFVNLHFRCKIIQAVDHISQIVDSAKRNADALHLNIEFYCSDLFSKTNGYFDMIVFNAPYLDLEKGRKRGILKDELSELRFSGGQGGGETIERFLLEAPKHMSSNGKLLLGVNHHHIPRNTLRDLISNSDFELCDCIESFFIPASAYLLRRR